jgi:hypothetical protein
MPLLVVFVSGNDAVIDTIAERRVSLVPTDLRAKSFAALDGEEVVLSGFKVTASCSFQNLLTHIYGLDLKNASGIVLLTDNALPGLVDRLGDVFSVNMFGAPEYGQNVVNLLQAVLAKALRTFRLYKKRFDDLKYQQILRLPMRNFASPEIGELRTACHDMMNRNNFGQEIEAILKRFRGRQQPKKASSRPATYLVDDNAKHFTLGHELHAQAETGMPPHNDLCIFGNGFRFGRAFDGKRHYNVSRDNGETIVGQYPDCHDVMRGHPVQTHINMFTNDYF